jgi:hypothetical protein
MSMLQVIAPLPNQPQISYVTSDFQRRLLDAVPMRLVAINDRVR